MPIKVAVFDLDQTLIDETLCRDTLSVLKQLRDNCIYMSVASYNRHALWFCDRYDITQYFDVIIGGRHTTKVEHIKFIMNYYKVDPTELILYDDNAENCVDALVELGINVHLVNKDVGILLEDIDDILSL